MREGCEKVLCLGGPADRQHVEIPIGAPFLMWAVMPTEPMPFVFDSSITIHDTKGLKITHVEYKRHKFAYITKLGYKHEYAFFFLADWPYSKIIVHVRPFVPRDMWIDLVDQERRRQMARMRKESNIFGDYVLAVQKELG